MTKCKQCLRQIEMVNNIKFKSAHSVSLLGATLATLVAVPLICFLGSAQLRIDKANSGLVIALSEQQGAVQGSCTMAARCTLVTISPETFLVF